MYRGYKLVRVDDKFRKPFKLNLGEDDFYNFINSMVEDCSDVMKKYERKELTRPKKDNEDFKNSTKCRICDNAYADDDVKVRDHFYLNYD